VSQPAPRPGERLDHGDLYRRVSNTIGHYDYQGRRAGKQAFRPSLDPDTGIRETGISTYLASLTTRGDTLRGHPGYGVCIISIEVFRAELARVRADPKARFNEDVAVTFSPSERDGPAHVYIDPVPAIVQKALRRIARMDVEPGPPVAGRPQYDPFDDR